MQAMASPRVALPRSFCWTRYGTEAGEGIAAILARKEAERLAGHGIFLWGVGSSIGPALAELLRRVRRPEVLFSPIKGRPRPADVAPAHVVRWTAAYGLHGESFELPRRAMVTSRWNPARPAGAHYALVCCSPAPLEFITGGSTLSLSALRNLRSGAPLGGSQVTAVVRRYDGPHAAGEYPVAFRAALVAPYFVRLVDPRPVRARRR